MQDASGTEWNHQEKGWNTVRSEMQAHHKDLVEYAVEFGFTLGKMRSHQNVLCRGVKDQTRVSTGSFRQF